MKSLPAGSRHLSVFAIDVCDFLEHIGLFSKIGVKKTGSPECALIVFCSVSSVSTTQNEIVEALESACEKVPFFYERGRNSYKITMATEEVRMHFSTSTDDVYVTGRIEIYGFK